MLKSNLIYNALNQAINVFFPIAIQFIVVRKLDVLDIGSLNLLYSLQAILLSVGASIDLHIMTVMSRSKSDDDCMLITNGLVLNFFLSFIAALLFLILSSFFIDLTARVDHAIIFIAMAISIIAMPLGATYYFQARLSNKFILKRRLISRIFILFGVLLFIRNPDDAVTYGILLPASIVLEAFFTLPHIRSKIKTEEIKSKKLFELLMQSWKMIIFNFSFGVLPQYSVVLGSVYFNELYFAEFTILIKIVNLVTSFISSSVMVLFPFKNSNKESTDYRKFDILSVIWTSFFSFAAASVLIYFKEIVFYMFLNKINPVMSREFDILVLYIPIHAIYNYYVFNKFLFYNMQNFVNILNTTVIGIFALIIVFNSKFEWGFSLTIILISATLLSLVIAMLKSTVIFYKSGGNKGA